MEEMFTLELKNTQWLQFVMQMNLYGLFRVYSATFFVFSDYLKPSARIAALAGIPQHFIWTHDSIGVEKMDQLTNQLSIYHNLEHYQISIHLDLLMQQKMLILGKLL